MDDKIKMDWNEEGEAVFTINFACPHCKKPLSISVDKITMTKIEEKRE